MKKFYTDLLAGEIKEWLYASAIGLGVIAILTLLSLPFAMDNDPYQSIRYLLVTPAKAIMAVIIVTGGILFIDFCTPGDFLYEASQGNLACAILSGCIVIGLCLLLGWS